MKTAHNGVLLRLLWAVSVIQAKSYWPNMVFAVSRHRKWCLTRHITIQVYTLYPRLVPFAPWQDANIDFMVGLPKAQCNKNSDMLWILWFIFSKHYRRNYNSVPSMSHKLIGKQK